MFESTARASCFERMKRLLDTNRRISVKLGLGSICVLLLTAALALPQIRAANPPAANDKVAANKEEPQPNTNNAGAVAAEKKRDETHGRIPTSLSTLLLPSTLYCSMAARLSLGRRLRKSSRLGPIPR